MNHTEFFDKLWKDYVSIAPAAGKLYDLVSAREKGPLANDHIAFRTYNLAPINLTTLEQHILALGYKRFAPYKFEDKKLDAFGYIHESDPNAARIFLSELRVQDLSEFAQKTIKGLCAQVDPRKVASPDILWSGRPWKIVDFATYEKLAAESEYAGWMAVHGFHANHFTISVNHLKTFKSIEELLDFVAASGYPLNTSGGRVKGNPGVLLEQGSTLGDEIEVTFADGKKSKVPSCYYEFARRYNDPSTGKLYDGFVAASADKIFESTNRR